MREKLEMCLLAILYGVLCGILFHSVGWGMTATCAFAAGYLFGLADESRRRLRRLLERQS